MTLGKKDSTPEQERLARVAHRERKDSVHEGLRALFVNGGWGLDRAGRT